MAGTITLRARQRFTHAGRVYGLGTTFQATPIEAASFLWRKLAEVVPEKAADTPKYSRRYKRRDMEPESR